MYLILINGENKMKKRIIMSIAVCLLTVGCSKKNEQLIEVKIVSVKTEEQFKGGWNEVFSHVMLERTDTKERIYHPNEELGDVGDVFTLPHYKIYGN